MTKLDRHHLEEIYDDVHSIPSCRPLLKEVGLSYQKPRRATAAADPGDREDSDETKKPGDGCHSSV